MLIVIEKGEDHFLLKVDSFSGEELVLRSTQHVLIRYLYLVAWEVRFSITWLLDT